MVDIIDLITVTSRDKYGSDATVRLEIEGPGYALKVFAVQGEPLVEIKAQSLLGLLAKLEETPTA